MTHDRNITRVVVEAGLVPDDLLEQMRRWGMPLETAVAGTKQLSVNEVVESIQEALESEDTVEMRDTDLDILRKYLHTQRRGKLHVQDGDVKATESVSFCINELGEVVIPWRSESLHDLMLNEGTHLRFEDVLPNGSTVKRKVHFCDVRELYLGSRKTFMVCKPVEPIYG